MKSIHKTLVTAAVAVLLLSKFSATALGYPPSHGPFVPGSEPTAVTLEKCELVREVKPPADTPAGAVREYRLPAARQSAPPITVTLHGVTNGWKIILRDAKGGSLLPQSFTNEMPTTILEMEVFSCELNGDSQPDFIINIWSGGCGLAAVMSEVTFLLSGKAGYRATSFDQYSFGKQDVVRFQEKGPVYFISSRFIGNGSEKTRDGRDHNFWVYQLHRIAGNQFAPAAAEQPGFPKWVWFTNRDNHDETTQLTRQQKSRLLKQHSIRQLTPHTKASIRIVLGTLAHFGKPI